MNIKAIIFDVDGVVLTTHNAQGRYFWSETVKEDLGLSKDHFQKIFSPDWNSYVVTGKIETISYLKRVFEDPLFEGLGLTPEKYIDYWLTKHNNIDGHINEEMIQLIQSLKIPCYLGTNQEFHRTNRVEKCIGKNFKGIFTSYKIGFIKPESAFFNHVEKELKLRSDEILLVDDTKENVEGAQKCGWHTYHYKGDFDNFKNFFKNEFVDF